MANVSSPVMRKVLEYLEHHRNDPLPPSESNDDGDSSEDDIQAVGEWDSRFIQLGRKILFDIILAANYLDIKPLMYVLNEILSRICGTDDPTRTDILAREGWPT